jgi:hypothetical protein
LILDPPWYSILYWPPHGFPSYRRTILLAKMVLSPFGFATWYYLLHLLPHVYCYEPWFINNITFYGFPPQYCSAVWGEQLFSSVRHLNKHTDTDVWYLEHYVYRKWLLMLMSYPQDIQRVLSNLVLQCLMSKPRQEWMTGAFCIALSQNITIHLSQP